MAHTKMLAWVDVNTSLTTQKRLSSIGLTLNVFSDLNAFIDYITKNATEPDSIILIISGLFGQQLMPMIEAFPQLRAIYIYCNDASKHIYWAQQYDRIGVDRVFSGENDLIARLTVDLKSTTSYESTSDTAFNRICITKKQNTPTISLFASTTCNKSTRDLTEEKVTFLWLQLLNDILINMPQLPTACNEMLAECRLACVDDSVQLRQIDEFREKYKSEDAVYWYTREIFLYPLLNRALRTENVDIIFKFRMIIIDLCRQLAHLFDSATYTTPTLTVYRGQRMSPCEIEKLCNNVSGLISMNSFVSTTLNEKETRRFLQEPRKKQQEQTVGVLFELTLDVELARKTNKPFADIRSRSYFPREEEILLSLGTVFRIEKINQQSSDLWHVTATMCTGFDDPQLKLLFDYSKAEICSQQRMTYSTYGKFLALMSNYDSAINYLTKLLDQQSSHLQLNNIELATIHNDLAYAYRESSRHSKALEHYNIALDLKQNRAPLDEIDLATTYSDMGWLLMNMNKIEEARNFHQKALTIRKKDFINNRSDTAMSLNCLGLVHAYMSEFDLANDYLKQALDIRQSCLPSQHPYIAMSYSSLGSYFELIGNGVEALKMHEQALSIYKSSVPSTHNILKSSYRNVITLCLEQEQWQKAIEHLKTILTCGHNHDDNTRAILLTELGQAYSGLGNHQCALISYQEALVIAKNAKNNTLISKLMKMIELANSKS